MQLRICLVGLNDILQVTLLNYSFRLFVACCPMIFLLFDVYLVINISV